MLGEVTQCHSVPWPRSKLGVCTHALIRGHRPFGVAHVPSSCQVRGVYMATGHLEWHTCALISLHVQVRGVYMCPQNMALKAWPSEHGPQSMALRTWPSEHGPQSMALRTWPPEHGPQNMAPLSWSGMYPHQWHLEFLRGGFWGAKINKLYNYISTPMGAR